VSKHQLRDTNASGTKSTFEYNDQVFIICSLQLYKHKHKLH